MNTDDVLSVVKNRIDGGVGVLNIDAELAGVLADISSRAEFLTDTAVIATVADTSDYDQPDDMKSIYEVALDGGASEPKALGHLLDVQARRPAQACEALPNFRGDDQ